MLTDDRVCVNFAPGEEFKSGGPIGTVVGAAMGLAAAARAGGAVEDLCRAKIEEKCFPCKGRK